MQEIPLKLNYTIFHITQYEKCPTVSCRYSLFPSFTVIDTCMPPTDTKGSVLLTCAKCESEGYRAVIFAFPFMLSSLCAC